ncbi:MAG: type II secretion system protein [Nitrospirota bacterium]
MNKKLKKTWNCDYKIVDRQTHPSVSSAKGFTLLEIMIALAIIGTALTVIVQTVNYHTNIMYENNLATQMMQTAKGKMYELETAPGNSDGVAAPGLSYENTAAPIKDTELVELRTVVKGHGRQVVLYQLVFNRPEWQLEQQ